MVFYFYELIMAVWNQNSPRWQF